MKLYKDISFWCIVLAIVVVMVVHHFLSKGQLIEGATNDEKCGSGSGIPCCWYNMWQDVEGTESQPHGTLNAEENLKTDGTVYLPLSMSGETPVRSEDVTNGTWQECQQRCKDTTDCVYFNSFPDGSCFITDGRDGEQIGIDNDTGGPSEDPEGKPTHSGRALALRENIPESKRFGLNQCKCAAAGEEPDVGWPEKGTPVEKKALQYGDNRNGSDVDCASNPEDSSCDAYGQSIPSTIDPAQATHFRCLIKSEVDRHLSDKATNLGMDISGFDSKGKYQENLSKSILKHISERKLYGLDPDSPQSAVDNKIEEKRLLRVKYGLPKDASDTELKQKQEELRAFYAPPPEGGWTEENLEEAIIKRELLADLYGIDADSGDWNNDLEKAMELRGSTVKQREQAKYCPTNPECNEGELQIAKDAWNKIRTNLNLPINATNEQVSAAMLMLRLYEFNTHTFTNCGKNGHIGPTLAECRAAYAPDGASDSGPGSFANTESFFNVTREGVQVWTVPISGDYSIDVYGAQGGGVEYGDRDDNGGKGARIKATFTLNKGDLYWILVGQQGGKATGTRGNYGESGQHQGAGGGGGSFFVKCPNNEGDGNISGPSITNTDLLIAAGGGGGSGSAWGSPAYLPGENASGESVTGTFSGGATISYNAGGGGGFMEDGNGTHKGKGFKTDGGRGGEGQTSWNPPSDGGFGGGGGAGEHASGGGGGAGGGDGGIYNGENAYGKAGSSYSSVDTSLLTEDGARSGHGQIIITLIEASSPARPPQPNTLENIYTDGRWYMPLNGIDGEEQTQAATWEECRDRCLDTPGCKFFNRFSSGGCHITDGSDGHEFRPGNPTSHSGSSTFMERDVTLPMSEEISSRNYSAATGGSVDCSGLTFLGVADSIRHNGHTSNWGTSMIDSLSPAGSKLQDYITNGQDIPCDKYYYYKPHTLVNLKTEDGGGWFQSIGDNGVSPSGFYTLQSIGGKNCTNYAVRTNDSNIADYACSDQSSRKIEDPSIPNPSEAILKGLGITSDD